MNNVRILELENKSKRLDSELKDKDNESKKLDNESDNIKLQLILAEIELLKLKK